MYESDLAVPSVAFARNSRSTRRKRLNAVICTGRTILAWSEEFGTFLWSISNGFPKG